MSVLYLMSLLAAVVAALVLAVAGLIFIGFAVRGPVTLRGPVDALVVFGSSVPWRARSRCAKAAALYRSGKVGEIVVSGGAEVPWRAMTEAEWFRDRLIRDGVPADHILLETESGSTIENVAGTRALVEARGYRSVALVSSEYLGLHVRYLVDQLWQGLDVRVFGAHASSRGHWSPWTWWASRVGWSMTWESFARYRRARMLLRTPEFTYASSRS